MTIMAITVHIGSFHEFYNCCVEKSQNFKIKIIQSILFLFLIRGISIRENYQYCVVRAVNIKNLKHYHRQWMIVFMSLILAWQMLEVQVLRVFKLIEIFYQTFSL